MTDALRGPSCRAMVEVLEDIGALEAEIAGCRACADEFAATHTAHEPRPVTRLSSTARILIAGQAPGLRVHESGVPFDDRSGDRLRDWMGVDRDVFYDRTRIAILPMAFCFPGYDAKGSDLPPPKRCAEIWRRRTLDALGAVELTLLVGGHAQKWALKDRRPLSAIVADWRAYAPSTIPLPHPSWRNTAWLKKNPWFEAETLPALRARVAALL